MPNGWRLSGDGGEADGVRCSRGLGRALLRRRTATWRTFVITLGREPEHEWFARDQRHNAKTPHDGAPWNIWKHMVNPSCTENYQEEEQSTVCQYAAYYGDPTLRRRLRSNNVSVPHA